MLKLNFDLYAGSVKLKDWWKQVKENFTDTQEAHNALEAALDAERQARLSKEQEIAADIDAERQGREDGDAAVVQLLSDETEKVYAAIDRDRQRCAEANNDAKVRLQKLENAAHSHPNAALLNGITADDIASWRAKSDTGEENRGNIAYILELLEGYEHEIGSLHSATGVTVYNGGFFYGADTSGEAVILDGGGIDEADEFVTDCGDFEKNSAMLDGGRF